MSKQRKIDLAERAKPEEKADLPLDRQRCGTVTLRFADAGSLEHVGNPLFQDVSSLAVKGRSIFCACDETSTIERISMGPEGDRAEEHVNFALGTAFDLPDGPAGEMDIEGMHIADGYLWVCGSHSLKRDDPEENGLRDMEDIDWDCNRGFLGRVPLIDRGDGIHDLAGAIEPIGEGKARTGRMLPMKSSRKTPLRKLLGKDALLGPFLHLPCKENGFDIEGLAVRGSTVLLGLRGPVISSLAIIVRLEMKESREGFLKPRKLENGKRYSLHVLDLNGQGIRDMAWDGERLLILSGATNDLEALQSVFALDSFDPETGVYPSRALERVLDLPVVRGSDHAEGIAVTEINGQRRLMIAYDSPHGDRVEKDGQTLVVDLFELGSP